MLEIVDEFFLPSAMAVVSATDACEETPYPHSTGVSLPPLPQPRAWEVSCHSPALDIAHPHITLSQGGPRVTWEGQDLPSQGLGTLSWPFGITHPRLLRICSTFTLPLSTCHLCLQFSALTRPWGGFVSNAPQWDPLTL